MKLTRAVPHIRLYAANDSKMATLDALAGEYNNQTFVSLARIAR
jgi:hypothetical protein